MHAAQTAHPDALDAAGAAGAADAARSLGKSRSLDAGRRP
jgi:hypothetical protein